MAEVVANLIEVETRGDPVEIHLRLQAGQLCRAEVMTAVESEAVCALPTRFAICPVHEQPDIETIVERHP